MKKILYLHGLNSEPGNKAKFIKKNFFCVSPNIDYKDPKCFNKLLNIVEENNFDFIIGNSLGGYFAFILGNIYNIDIILLNPALKKQSIDFKEIPKFNFKNIEITLLLGGKDDIIDPTETINYLNKNNITYKLFFNEKLGHRIRTKDFEIFINSIL